jgi:hypothetical protein
MEGFHNIRRGFRSGPVLLIIGLVLLFMSGLILIDQASRVDQSHEQVLISSLDQVWVQEWIILYCTGVDQDGSGTRGPSGLSAPP